MPHPLDGCRAKVRRARFHAAELVAAVQTEIPSAPYRIRSESDHGTGTFLILAETNPEFTGIPIDLPLIAGEAAHQLRSALDHLVWQLVVANTGAPPGGNRSGFPIFKTQAGYEQRAPSMIAGVSDAAAGRIRAAQPFNAGDGAERVLTWILHELNNADKHRLIPVVLDHTSVVHVHLRKRDGSLIEVVPVREELREPLRDGLEIARLSITDIADGDSLDVPFGFDLAFEQLGDVQRHPATQLLGEMADYIERLVESFSGEFG